MALGQVGEMTRYNKKDGFKFKGEPTPCGVGSNYVGGCCAACGAQATSIWLDEDPPVSACDEHKEYIRAGTIELELVPQGNLAERLRAAGAGIGAFFTPTGFGTELARNADGSEKETRVINGKSYVLEYPILGDVALIKAERGDRWGNLTYRKAARNFGPVMATAAKRTIASVYEIAELGSFDPEAVVTPGIHVSAVVRIPRVATQAGGFKTAA